MATNFLLLIMIIISAVFVSTTFGDCNYTACAYKLLESGTPDEICDGADSTVTCVNNIANNDPDCVNYQTQKEQMLSLIGAMQLLAKCSGYTVPSGCPVDGCMPNLFSQSSPACTKLHSAEHCAKVSIDAVACDSIKSVMAIVLQFLDPLLKKSGCGGGAAGLIASLVLCVVMSAVTSFLTSFT